MILEALKMLQLNSVPSYIAVHTLHFFLSVCLGLIVFCNVKMVPGRGRRVAGRRSRAGVSDVIRAKITDHAINHTLSVREAGLRRLTNLQLLKEA